MSTKRWIVREQDERGALALAELLGISKVVAGLLLERGCVDEACARKFLRPSHDQ